MRWDDDGKNDYLVSHDDHMLVLCLMVKSNHPSQDIGSFIYTRRGLEWKILEGRGGFLLMVKGMMG